MMKFTRFPTAEEQNMTYSRSLFIQIEVPRPFIAVLQNTIDTVMFKTSELQRLGRHPTHTV